jgi:hypothetical protein
MSSGAATLPAWLSQGVCHVESLLSWHLTSRKDQRPKLLGGRQEIECLLVEGFEETDQESLVLVELQFLLTSF